MRTALVMGGLADAGKIMSTALSKLIGKLVTKALALTDTLVKAVSDGGSIAIGGHDLGLTEDIFSSDGLELPEDAAMTTDVSLMNNETAA